MILKSDIDALLDAHSKFINAERLLSNLLLYQEACGTSDGLEDRAALQSEVESHSVAVQKIRDTITQNDLPCGHPKSCLIFADNGPYEAPGEFCGWCSEAWPVEALRNQVRELKVLVESISQIQVSSLSGPGQADLIRSTKCRLCGAPNKTHTKDCPVGKAFRV
jgi:hypothetical protein